MAVGVGVVVVRGQLWGGVRIIFDYDLMRFNTTGFVRSSSPYHPRGASIFPDHRRSIRTKEKEQAGQESRIGTHDTE